WFISHANGKTYLAKETGPCVYEVDEPGRRLIPIYKVGAAFYPGGNAGWQIPPELQPQESPWPGQTSPEPKPPAPWHYVWYDPSGKGNISPANITFGRELIVFPHQSYVRPDLTYITDAEVSWKDPQNIWHRGGGSSVLHPSAKEGQAFPDYDLDQ